MAMEAQLRRFWFKFDNHSASPLGYGVTAWTEEDAAAILSKRIFDGAVPPKATIIADVDVSTLDPGHIRPNMESPSWRGIWFPRGYAETTK